MSHVTRDRLSFFFKQWKLLQWRVAVALHQDCCHLEGETPIEIRTQHGAGGRWVEMPLASGCLDFSKPLPRLQLTILAFEASTLSVTDGGLDNSHQLEIKAGDAAAETFGCGEV